VDLGDDRSLEGNNKYTALFMERHLKTRFRRVLMHAHLHGKNKSYSKQKQKRVLLPLKTKTRETTKRRAEHARSNDRETKYGK
jgi:hypothetical protein